MTGFAELKRPSRHWFSGVAIAVVAVGLAMPAGAVTNQDPGDLADAIEAAKSATTPQPQFIDPWSVEAPRRSCGWWTVDGQNAVVGGAQHALLCAPPAVAPELDGA